MSYLLHLVRRFFGSLNPAGPAASDEAWVRTILNPAEIALWEQMSGPDRRHGVAVAKRTQTFLNTCDDNTLTAALLHDVGKIDSALDTFGRVAATLAALTLGHSRVSRWHTRSGFLGRIGKYVRHPETGARLLTEAGSAQLAITWALHHQSRRLPEAGTCEIPHSVLEALRAADDA